MQRSLTKQISTVWTVEEWKQIREYAARKKIAMGVVVRKCAMNGGLKTVLKSSNSEVNES